MSQVKEHLTARISPKGIKRLAFIRYRLGKSRTQPSSKTAALEFALKEAEENLRNGKPMF